MRNGTVALILGALLMACGGDEAAPPPAAPPAPPMAATPMTPAPTMTAAAPAAPKPSMAEMQAATAKSVSESMNAHDAKKFAATFSEDGVWNFAGAGEYKGRAEIEKQIQSFFDGFKDVKFSFTRAWMKGDMAAMEWSWAGTNTGEFMGMKPTEKQAGGMGLSLVWFNPDGTVKRNNHYTDMATTMTQLGAVKGKARAVPSMAANMDAWSAKGTPDEDKNVDGWKSMMAGLENKKEADFLGVLSDDVEWHDMTQPESHKGKAEGKKAYGMLTKAFPDIKFQPATTMGVGDTAIVEYTMTGTMKGPMGPIPAKNKPVTVHGVHILQMKDGKVAKGWDYANNVEMLTQLGMMKPPGAAGAKAADPKAGDKKTDAKGATPATPAKPATPAAGGGDKKPATPATPAKPAADKKAADPAKKP